METYAEEFRAADRLMHVRLAGTYPKERLATKANLFDPLIEACLKDGCSAAIVDARALTVDFDAAEIFRAGVDMAALNQLGIYVAIVAREDMVNPFFDDVLYNRCARARVFTNTESAKAWINTQPRARPAAGN